jgi:hypothetical protein
MSKVSRKSDLSPSITKGSNGIDLGKRDADMGRKSEPSITSGGLGISQEVTNIGGMSVTGGVSVDISPVNFGINVNPSENSVSIAGGAEVPGGLLGISGGLTIDTNTGEIIGGSIGGEIGGFGINVSNSEKGGLGIEFTVQIPGTPIELGLGLGFPKEPEPTTKPPPISRPGVGSSPSEVIPLLDEDCTFYAVLYSHGRATKVSFDKPLKRVGEHNYYSGGTWTSSGNVLQIENLIKYLSPGVIEWHDYPSRPDRAGYKINDKDGFAFIYGNGVQSPGIITGQNEAITFNGGNAFWLIESGRSMKASIEYWSNSSIEAWEISLIKISCLGDGPETKPTPLTPVNRNNAPSTPSPQRFPHPPPRRRNKMDDCCKSNLKILRAIYIRLGLAKFPGKLPATIIQEVPKEGEKPAEPPQVPINDFVDLFDWQFRRDDERWGQWVVQIDVRDADITKEGDQKKQIKFPNLAESIAEMEGQILSLTANVDALVALQVKNLAESGMARQEAIKGYLAAKAIIKYMAFKSSEVDVPIPMTFTAGAESISELLKESEGHIKGTDYTEKETLRDVYLDLLQAAAIIRAVHWQRIDTKSDTKNQLLSILKGSVNLASTITNPKKSTDGEEKKFDPAQNFEDFIDDVENGFRNTTGISDIENPYGRTPDRRPRIREIGDNLSEAGGDN